MNATAAKALHKPPRSTVSANDTVSAPAPEMRDHIGYRIRRLNNLLTLHSKQVASQDLGLPLAQWRVLFEVGTKGATHPRAVADASGLERSHVTHAVNALLERRLVTRTSDSEDGRRVVLSLTVAGRAMLQRGIAASTERRNLLHGALSARERQTFLTALAKLTGAVEHLLAQAPPGDAPTSIDSKPARRRPRSPRMRTTA